MSANTLLISSSDDHDIRLWSIETNLKPDPPQISSSATLTGHLSPVICLEIMPGLKLASGSADSSIRVWSLTEKVCKQQFTGHSASIECLCAFGENKLISGSSDKTIKIWDLASECCVWTLLGHTDWITSLQVINDEFLLSGAGLFSSIIWDMLTGDILISLKGQHYLEGFHHKIQILSNNQFIFGTDDFNLRIWNLEDSVSECPIKEFIHSKLTYEDHIITCRNGVVKLYDLREHFNGTKTHDSVVFSGHTGVILSISILAGRRMASGSADSTIRVWDLSNGVCLWVLQGHTGPVLRVSELREDRLVTGSSDSTLRVWDLGTGDCLKKLVGHSKSIVCFKVVESGFGFV